MAYDFGFICMIQRRETYTLYKWSAPEINIGYKSGTHRCTFTFDLVDMNEIDIKNILSEFAKHIPYASERIVNHPLEYTIRMNFDESIPDITNKVFNALHEVLGCQIPSDDD